MECEFIRECFWMGEWLIYNFVFLGFLFSPEEVRSDMS